ncbi:type II toxin-antitoxin system Phd/YefM family antitoxin [Methylothermus subterraneus]
MRAVNITEARDQLRKLIDAVIAGEEIIICRRDKPVAKLIRATERPVFPDRRQFRNRFRPARTVSAEIVRQMREEQD